MSEEDFHARRNELMLEAATHWSGYEVFMKCHVTAAKNDYRRILYLLEANMRLQEYFDAVERVLTHHYGRRPTKRKKLT